MNTESVKSESRPESGISLPLPALNWPSGWEEVFAFRGAERKDRDDRVPRVVTYVPSECEEALVGLKRRV